MPANIAHMLIAHKTLNKLREKSKEIQELQNYINIFDDDSDRTKLYKSYYNLGSLGPDLFYYSRRATGIKDLMFDVNSSAKGVEPWSYHLHSVEPNKFPLKMIEILFRDALKDPNGKYILEDQDRCKLAFIAGYLTHIAADQIIHPIVDAIAGPYYRSGENREKHRNCEAFQDYFLYLKVYDLEGKPEEQRYDFFEQKFNTWCDCITGLTTRNTEDWFRYFIQRAFAETYNILPEEDIIEDSVDNLLMVLRLCDNVGPYKKAAKEYAKYGEKSGNYIEFIEKIDYLKYYRIAVELSVVYLLEFYNVVALLENNVYFPDDEKTRSRFLNIVDNADLTRPLNNDILSKSSKYYKANVTDISETIIPKSVAEEISIFSEKEILSMESYTEIFRC